MRTDSEIRSNAETDERDNFYSACRICIMRVNDYLRTIGSAKTRRESNFQFVRLLAWKRKTLIVLRNKTEIAVSGNIDDFDAIDLKRIESVAFDRIENCLRTSDE